MVHHPHIVVSADMLFFARKFYVYTLGIRTHQDEHFDLSYTKIALQTKKLQILEIFKDFDFKNWLPVILYSDFFFFQELAFYMINMGLNVRPIISE